MRDKIPQPIKKYGRKVLDIRDRALAVYWEKTIIKNPEKHAKREMKRQKQDLLRATDLENPKYFSEKMLWLKYFLYNDSPLVAQCYNKYEVRKYVESKGLKNILNELYGVWDSVDDVTWDTLPEEYVMKISNGYDNHVFKREGEPFSIKKSKETLNASKSRSKFIYVLTGDLFVKRTNQYVICERLLHSNLGFKAPEDYKFYCFNGKPKFIEFMANREGGSVYNEAFVDINLNDRHDLEGEAHPGTIKKPTCFDEMIDIAKILSHDFPFVRVDLYVENEKPIFGELTFTPFHNQTKQSEIELGAEIDLKNTVLYKELLSRKQCCEIGRDWHEQN